MADSVPLWVSLPSAPRFNYPFLVNSLLLLLPLETEMTLNCQKQEFIFVCILLLVPKAQRSLFKPRVLSHHLLCQTEGPGWTRDSACTCLASTFPLSCSLAPE